MFQLSKIARFIFPALTLGIALDIGAKVNKGEMPW